MHAIEGIPSNCQILHVEQEVVGDDTTALQCVLNSDIERAQLMQEEANLLARQVEAISFFFLSKKTMYLCIDSHHYLCPFSYDHSDKFIVSL